MRMYVESLELIDKESATTCGETVTWRTMYRHNGSCFYTSMYSGPKYKITY